MAKFGEGAGGVALVVLSCLAVHCGSDGHRSGAIGPCASRAAPPSTSSAPIQPSPFQMERLGEEGIESECLIIEDIDANGHADLIVASKSYDPQEGLQAVAHVWWGEEGRGFHEQSIPFPSGASPTSGCTAGDIDGDGLVDLLFGTVEGDVAALVQTSPGVLEAYGHLTDLPEELKTQRFTTLVLHDLDGVPPLDLLAGSFATIANTGCVGAPSDAVPGEDIFFDRPILEEARILCMQSIGGRYVLADKGLCPASLQERPRGPVWAAQVMDLNDDGHNDVIFSGDYSENIVLLGLKGGGLADATVGSGIPVYNHAMGFSLEDFDQDGIRDLFVTDTGPDQFWKGKGCGVFEDASQESLVAPATDRGYGWGVASLDLELDGDQDLFVTNSFVTGPAGWLQENLCFGVFPGNPPQTHFLLNNDGTGRFLNVQIPLEEPFEYFRTPVTMGSGDLDRDGDVEVVVIENQQITIYWNDSIRAGNFLSVVARETPGTPAVGARVIVVDRDGAPRFRDVHGTHGRDGHSELAAHFGLGGEAGPVDIQVRWPNGEWSRLEDVAVNQRVVITRSP